jgi:hypothetical protein
MAATPTGKASLADVAATPPELKGPRVPPPATVRTLVTVSGSGEDDDDDEDEEAAAGFRAVVFLFVVVERSQLVELHTRGSSVLRKRKKARACGVNRAARLQTKNTPHPQGRGGCEACALALLLRC